MQEIPRNTVSENCLVSPPPNPKKEHTRQYNTTRNTTKHPKPRTAESSYKCALFLRQGCSLPLTIVLARPNLCFPPSGSVLPSSRVGAPLCLVRCSTHPGSVRHSSLVDSRCGPGSTGSLNEGEVPGEGAGPPDSLKDGAVARWFYGLAE